MNVSFDEFIKIIKSYNPEEVGIITKAYEFAKRCHDGQFRQSGEPYIVHPLAVATILANMHADCNTVCAGLLHDVIEDCAVTMEEIATEFNETVASLVDGVTNLTQVNFETKTERDYATKRKIILGITKDARIIIIKLADRLHNILTLQYKKADKRIEKANETLQFYVPLARYIGAEKLRRQLEDLAFMYANPQEYLNTRREVSSYVAQKRESLNRMFLEIYEILKSDNVPIDLKLRIKGIYSVYRRISRGETIENLHDFLAIKILVHDVRECYNVLRLIHSLYEPLNQTFRDYICKPKSNMYSSLHSSVFGPDGVLVQIQIRTNEMEKINMEGLTAYWDLCRGEAENRMQEILRDKYGFVKSVKKISRIIADNRAFVSQVQRDVIGESIYVYDYNGHLVQLPEGATVVDFAYSFGKEYGDRMVGVFVNGQAVDVGTVLYTGDRVHVLTSDYELGPRTDWLADATTVNAQRLIRRFRKQD